MRKVLTIGVLVFTFSLIEFIIFNLGDKDGVEIGQMMSVYRGKDYLGDVKVTRVQPEMAAADFIPPFSSRQVRRGDQVLQKQ